MSRAAASPAAGPDWSRVRADFPLLQSAGARQAARLSRFGQYRTEAGSVIEAVDDFYRRHNANVSRAVHRSAARPPRPTKARAQAGELPQGARDELVLCSGTTFAINLVAYSWALAAAEGRRRHPAHAHGAPRQHRALAAGRRAHRRAHQGRRAHAGWALDLDALCRDDAGGQAAGLAHVSNVLGTVNPVREICREARKRGIVTVVDGSQAAPHMALDIAARSAAISTPSPATRCAARPAPARCGRDANTWPRCRRSSAAAR
jgi:cysteine desulfurase/selenocysteine lyase